MALSNFVRAPLWVFLLTLAPSIAHSQSSIPYQSTRLLGMGGLAPAGATHGDILWQNPATLGFLGNDLTVDVINPMISASNPARSAFTTPDLADIQALKSLAEEASSEPVSGHARIFPNITTKGLGFGIIADAIPEAKIENLESAHVNLAAHADGGAILGMGQGFLDNTLAIGVAIKALKYIRYTETFSTDPDIQAAMSPKVLLEGATAALDIGFLLRAPISTRPTLGVTFVDVLVTPLHDPFPTLKNSNTINTSNIKRTTNVGFALHPHLGLMQTQILMGIRNVSNLTLHEEGSLTSHAHAGIELSLRETLFLRGGIAYGQGSAGVGIQVSALRIDLSTFVEPSLTKQNQQDRQFATQLTLGF